MKTVGSFQVKSLKDAGLTSGEWTGLVATSETFLVWGHRMRVGQEGFRRYIVKFSVSRRDKQPIELPVKVGHSDLKKILAHLETL